MKDDLCKIRIKNGDQEFELEGSSEFVENMLKRFAGHIPPKTVSTKKEGKLATFEHISEEGLIGKELSISEFIRKLKFKKHTDMVLGFGYYLEKFLAVKEFTPADINNCYYEAKMESSNTSQMIVQLIRRGHLMLAKPSEKKVKGKKCYILTGSGEQFIEQHLSKMAE